MVFVSGMFIATKHATRRNAFILMLSMALGIGVAMEPHLFEGGGVASFYGKNLQHNTGFWPRYKTCKTFPVDSETGALVRTCTNNNGACCSEYDKGEDSNRTAAIILLKTPYSIGFVLCGNQPVCRVHFSAMTRPSWLGRAVRNRHRHAIEQAPRRWRGGRRDDSARTRRKILISTQASSWPSSCTSCCPRTRRKRRRRTPARK